MRNVLKDKCHWKLVEEVEEREEMTRHEGAKDEQNGVWEQGSGQCAGGGGRGGGWEGWTCSKPATGNSDVP